MAARENPLDHYIIRGGEAGKKRLDLLARVQEPTTLALLDKLDIRPGERFIDLGCGGGHVSIEAARRVGAGGSVVGVDLDATKLALARQSAEEGGLGNIDFRECKADEIVESDSFDVAYARFLLTHLSDPLAVLRAMLKALKPGARVALEDIDFRGVFSHPPSPHVERFAELYTVAVRHKGGDANIGPRLPSLLREAGFEQIGASVVQVAYLDGDLKRILLATMEGIADAALAAGMATVEELGQTVEGLRAFTDDPTTFLSMPRVVQAWGVKPS